ncbi:MAG: hypothetical protein U0132_12250 [Gemmatimonadaceae bacterium]
MPRAKTLIVALGLMVARVAQGQGGSIDPQCVSGSLSERATQDACQKAVDLFHFMAPQLGASLIGGNVVAGESGALGGLGHISVGLRGNVLRGHLPDVSAVTPAITGAVASDYAVKDKPVGLPVADLALGVFPGVRAGSTTIFAVDGLMNIAFIPEVTSGDFKVSVPSGSIRFGFGARIAVLEESEHTPAVSIAFLQRDLPSADVTATPGLDLYGVRAFTLTSDAWRAMVGKSFGPLSLVIGGGSDHYDASGLVDVTVNRAAQVFTLTGFEIAQSLNRQNVFADLSLNTRLMRVVLEVGQVSGGSLATYNTFGGTRADDALQFASLGLRLHW